MSTLIVLAKATVSCVSSESIDCKNELDGHKAHPLLG